MSNKYYCGIDLGGTKIFAVIANEKGEVIATFKQKTKDVQDNSGQTTNSSDAIIERLVTCYNTVIEKAQITSDDVQSVGVAVPSSVNIKEGILIYAPNLGLKEVPIAKLLKDRINKPIFVDNDVNMGIYGEYCLGAGKGYKNIYGLFVGTGIGGGYIVNGEVVRGVNYTAGEIGHMVVKIGGPKCNCGCSGCLEAIAGKVGIISYMKRKSKKNKTLLDSVAPKWKQTVGSSALKKCYDEGDKIVTKALHRSAETIGIACANLINVVGVDAIVIGGGVIEEMGDIFMPVIKENANKYSIANGAKNVAIVEAALGDNSVALGAAWFTAMESNKDYLL